MFMEDVDTINYRVCHHFFIHSTVLVIATCFVHYFGHRKADDLFVAFDHKATDCE